MPKIIVTKDFKFAHRGYLVEDFTASPDEVETTDECADLAVAEGWAQLPKLAAPVATVAPAARKRAAEPKAAKADQSPPADLLASASSAAQEQAPATAQGQEQAQAPAVDGKQVQATTLAPGASQAAAAAPVDGADQAGADTATASLAA